MNSPREESATWLAAYHSEQLQRRRRSTYGRKLRRLGLMENAAGLSTLDIACGSGEALTLLADQGARLFGIDLYAPRGPLAEPFHRTVGDGTRLPFRDATFDRVLCMHSLHHFRSFAGIESLLREARRVLKGQGALFLLDHFDSFYLQLIFRTLEASCLDFLPAAKSFGAQLREERDIIFWWLANWRTLFRVLEDTGFQVRSFKKGLFFFYLVCNPVESR
ncbi:MAG: class I SAM-dependent methyltransferase [Candidatus Latescibacteria bacterium]|nr:class I SAM-dependent methyltransferase [Candidatus Latescibacterota bacterium]